jgi:hypothetical protein
MQPPNQNGTGSSAFAIGERAIFRVVDETDEFCSWEKKRIELASAGEKATLDLKIAWLTERLDALRQVISQCPPNPATRRVLMVYHALVAAVCFFVGLDLAYLCLAPFGFGFAAVLAALGCAVVTAFWTDQLLKSRGDRFKRILPVVGFAAAVAGGLLLAFVRGDVFNQSLQSALSGGEVALDQSVAFYSDAVWKLQGFLVLFGFALEIAAGLAWHELLELINSGSETDRAKNELAAVETELLEATGRRVSTESAPALAVAEFKSEIHRGILSGAGRRI